MNNNNSANTVVVAHICECILFFVCFLFAMTGGDAWSCIDSMSFMSNVNTSKSCFVFISFDYFRTDADLANIKVQTFVYKLITMIHNFNNRYIRMMIAPTKYNWRVRHIIQKQSQVANVTQIIRFYRIIFRR